MVTVIMPKCHDGVCSFRLSGFHDGVRMKPVVAVNQPSAKHPPAAQTFLLFIQLYVDGV